MSSPTADLAAIRRATINLYDGITYLMLLGIGILTGYILWTADPIGPIVCEIQGGTSCQPSVNPLITPGGEESFGLALALIFLMSALIFHVVDRTYRVWPLGRRVTTEPPAMLTEASYARLLIVIVILAAGAGSVYLLASLITS